MKLRQAPTLFRIRPSLSFQCTTREMQNISNIWHTTIFNMYTARCAHPPLHFMLSLDRFLELAHQLAWLLKYSTTRPCMYGTHRLSIAKCITKCCSAGMGWNSIESPALFRSRRKNPLCSYAFCFIIRKNCGISDWRRLSYASRKTSKNSLKYSWSVFQEKAAIRSIPECASLGKHVIVRHSRRWQCQLKHSDFSILSFCRRVEASKRFYSVQNFTVIHICWPRPKKLIDLIFRNLKNNHLNDIWIFEQAVLTSRNRIYWK